jgi:hypothetical protein
VERNHRTIRQAGARSFVSEALPQKGSPPCLYVPDTFEDPDRPKRIQIQGAPDQFIEGERSTGSPSSRSGY